MDGRDGDGRRKCRDDDAIGSDHFDQPHPINQSITSQHHTTWSLTCRFFCRSASTSARILCSCCKRTILFLIFATDGRLRVRSSSGTSSAVCGTTPIVSTKRSGLRARFFDRPRYSLELPVTLPSPPPPPPPLGAERFRELIVTLFRHVTAMTVFVLVSAVLLVLLVQVDWTHAEPNIACSLCNWQTLTPGSLRWCACCADGALAIVAISSPSHHHLITTILLLLHRRHDNHQTATASAKTAAPKAA